MRISKQEEGNVPTTDDCCYGKCTVVALTFGRAEHVTGFGRAPTTCISCVGDRSADENHTSTLDQEDDRDDRRTRRMIR